MTARAAVARPAATAVTLVLIASGCAGPGERPPLSDWSEGYGQDGQQFSGNDQPPDDTPGPVASLFGISPEQGSNIPMRLHVTGGTGDCVAENLSGTPAGFRAVECTADIQELDLHGPGLSFALHTPPGLCAYLIYWWYQYEVWEVGRGPDSVSYTLDSQGGFTDEVNSRGGVPYCPYDYRDLGARAPNCCLGSYVLSVTYAQTGKVTVYPPRSWGGDPAKCYGGAAFLWPEAKFDADGWPLTYYQLINYTETTAHFEWPGVAALYRTNVPLASYYQAANHGDGKPAGLAGQWAVEHYNLVCADHAYEWLAHIKLDVREWNEEAEFERGGNPDTVGTEPSGQPIDDFADWAVATPGPATFLRDRQ